MTNEIVSQPDPPAVERVLHQNLAEYAFDYGASKTIIVSGKRSGSSYVFLAAR